MAAHEPGMVPEVMEMLGVKLKWVNSAVAKKRFAYVKTGKLVRFRRSVIEAYIEAQTVPPADQ